MQGPVEAAMAAPNGSKEIRCVCEKAFIWMRPEGVEFSCRQCKRRLTVPWRDVGGPESLMHFVDGWRRTQRPRRPRS